MSNPFDDVLEFHVKFGLIPDRDMDATLGDFRYGFMKEEMDEFYEAMLGKDKEKMFDAMLDLTYVAIGTMIMMDIPVENIKEGWRRVHEANLTKVRAKAVAESRRGSTYDVVKPKDFVPPDLSDLV